MKKRIIAFLLMLSILVPMTEPVLPSAIQQTRIAEAKQIKGVKASTIRKRYKKLKKGMTFAKVKKILKYKPTSLEYSDDYGDYTEKQYQWNFYLGKWEDIRIYVTFEDGKLTQKMYLHDD